jgi:hypothetical protein
MTSEQVYINGFVKRAADYGYSQEGALRILKQANVQTMQPKQDPMVIPRAPGAPSHIPPYKPTYNPPAQTETISPEINKQLTSPSALSGMTPKNKWEQGLHDIMAKKPVFAANTGNFFGENRPPTQADIADGHIGDIFNAIGYNIGEQSQHKQPTKIPNEQSGIKSIYKKLVNRISSSTPSNSYDRSSHMDSLKEHFKQYDSSWGNNFRVPLPDVPEGINPAFIGFHQDRKNIDIPDRMHSLNYWKTRK